MRPLIDWFDKNENAQKLERRLDGFRAIMKHLDQTKDGVIIETGVSRNPDNFEGDGMSTYWWDWVSEIRLGYRAFSIDNNERSCAWARLQFPHVKVTCGDSVKTLADFDPKLIQRTRLLYLDSFDWSVEQNLDSAFHHFKELATVWALLPRGCLVVVDDRHTDVFGKHAAVAAFMQNLGVEPLFVGYQIGWVKP